MPLGRFLVGNCTGPWWFLPRPHPHRAAGGDSSPRGKHAHQGDVSDPVTRASNDDDCIWLKACPFLLQEALRWHMIIAQFLLGSWSYADRLQQISCYLLISALRAGQLPSSPPPTPCLLLECWLTPLFYPPNVTPWFLDNLCLKSNTYLWHYLPC